MGWVACPLLSGCPLIPEADLASRMDLDGDGVPRPEDCDDDDAAAGAPTMLYIDADEDGYGGTATGVGCATAGYADAATDCEDGEPQTFPGAVEGCDSRDNNCDGAVDEGVATTWYFDGDGDGWGADSPTEAACDQPEGYEAVSGDCDDEDALINPDTLWHPDADSDGFGDAAAALASCDAPPGCVADATDCDDTRADVSPATEEQCDADNVDEDCDGAADDDDVSATGQVLWFTDADGDGDGTVNDTTSACDLPAGSADNHDDCDDADPMSGPDCPYVTVSAGATHSCAIKSDGDALCWGTGAGSPPDGAFTDVSAGDGTTCGVVAGGGLVCWGKDTNGLVSAAPAGSFTAVSVGAFAACAIGLDTTITCWGRLNGVAAPTDTGYNAVSVGEESACALASDASLAAWGWATSAEGPFRDISANKEGCNALSVAGELVDPDGAFGSAIPSGPFVGFDVGQIAGCAITPDGTLTCFGDDTYGESSPPSGSFTSVSMSPGTPHACAITTSGSVVCWGYDGDGAAAVP
ncbi:hypothetical protein LBMAG42_42560 [Deltaproteobacteria bacterium]|nr:hypothetical protein LBMAG42_42560 [Deltaproteobacteria bacterium]